MKDTAKPMKSIRQAILTTLNTHGELTVDGMLDQVSGFDRKIISSNVAQLVSEQLATRRKDDFTGAPAYRITDLGKSRIKSDAAPAKPVVKETLTTEKPSAILAELRKLVDDGAAENERLHAELKVKATRINNLYAALEDSQDKVECHRIEVATLTDECNRLRDAVVAKEGEISRIAFEQTQCAEQQVTVEQFLIRVPKRKPEVVKSFDKARQRALRAAKTVCKVEVFAMVKVGHAERGAVWNQA